MDRIYLIKNPTPWMIDELIVFSRHAQFKVIFIRKPGEYYTEKLAQLKKNEIDVICCPFTLRINLRKIAFCASFILRNLKSFFSRYSFVVGVKSIWWFLKIDDSYFKKQASIHAQFATQPALMSLLLSKYHHKSQINYFFTFHAYDIFFDNRWFVKLANNSKMCFSISEYNIDYVLNKYKGLDRSKLELSRLGAFSNISNQDKKVLSEYFRIGLISWFVEKKGIKYLLEAMKEIAGRNMKIKLVLAGDGPLRKKIEQYITEHNLGAAIHYIGKLNFEEKAEFFSNLDAFILPAVTVNNDKDGIPVVLMEAISHGLPIISTNVSGIPEICINNFNGLLIPEKNVAAIIKAIDTLYNNRVMLRQFASNSLQLFNSYDIESNSYNKLWKLNWIKKGEYAC